MSANKPLNRKEQLEQVATLLFMEKGYVASTMRDLANKLGIEAASLYSHIKSKEEILQKICSRMAKEFFEAINKIESEESQSMSEKLSKYIIAHTEVITRDTAAAQVFINEWKHLSDPHLSAFMKQRLEYETRFVTILEKGILSGDFEIADVKLTVLTILSSLNWIPNWFKPTGEMNAHQIGSQLANILINGIRASR